MENTDSNEFKNITDSKKAKAGIFTLAVGITVLIILVFYILITHNSVGLSNDYLVKPELDWLSSIGLVVSLITYLLFWISNSILKYLPTKKHWLKFTVILGLFSLLLTSTLLFFSYDIENQWIDYVGYIGLITGISTIVAKEVINYTFNQKIANILQIIGNIVLFTGIFLLNYSTYAQYLK